jgi:hypothetical protein
MKGREINREGSMSALVFLIEKPLLMYQGQNVKFFVRVGRNDAIE